MDKIKIGLLVAFVAIVAFVSNVSEAGNTENVRNGLVIQMKEAPSMVVFCVLGSRSRLGHHTHCFAIPRGMVQEQSVSCEIHVVKGSTPDLICQAVET